MYQFKTPLLKAMPRAVHENRLSVMKRRALVVLVLVLLIGLPFLLLNLGLLSPSGPGYGIYWIHDRIYLPLKGYTYHLFFPISLVWCIVAGLLTVCWLVFYLVDESLLLSPHRDLLGWTLRRTRWHGLLLATARPFQRRSFPQRLMIEVAEYQRQRVLAKRRQSKQTKGRKDTLLLPLTRLQMQLLTLPGSTRSDRLWAGLCWLEAFQETLIKPEDPINPEYVQEIMAVALDGKPLQGKVQFLLSKTTALSTESLFLDLVHVASLHSPKVASTFLEASLSKLPQAGMNDRIGGILGATLNLRMGVLESWRRCLESVLFGGSALSVVRFPERLPNSPEELRFLGRLTMALALVQARLSGDPRAAKALMETCESLQCVLNCMSEVDEPNQAEFIAQCQSLLAEIPTAEDYRACAQLLAETFCERQRQWRQSSLQLDAIASQDDFEMSAAIAQSLFTAAGPGMQTLPSGEEG